MSTKIRYNQEIVNRLENLGLSHMLEMATDATEDECFHQLEAALPSIVDLLKDGDVISFTNENPELCFDFMINDNDRCLGQFGFGRYTLVGRPCENQSFHQYVDIYLREDGRDFYLLTVSKLSLNEIVEGRLDLLLTGKTKWKTYGFPLELRRPVFNGNGPKRKYSIQFDDSTSEKMEEIIDDLPFEIEADSPSAALYEYMRGMSADVWQYLDFKSMLIAEPETDECVSHTFALDCVGLSKGIVIDGVKVNCIHDPSAGSEHMFSVYIAGHYEAPICIICDLMPEEIAKEKIRKALEVA